MRSSDVERRKVSRRLASIHETCEMPDWRGFCACVLDGDADAAPSPLRKLKAFAKLASLLDCPTCRNVAFDEDKAKGYFECSECHATAAGRNVHYCANCGAEVVE